MGEKSTTKPFQVLSAGEEDTFRIAAIVASHLRVGDVLILTGDLACGKTYFVKGLAAALGSPDTVTSPTYALVHTYSIRAGDLMHIDAYRLTDIHEFRDLGLDEYLDQSITVIEWGDKVASEFDDWLSIAFHLVDGDSNRRLLTFHCSGKRWTTELAHLKEETGGSDDAPGARH